MDLHQVVDINKQQFLNALTAAARRDIDQSADPQAAFAAASVEYNNCRRP